MDLKSNFLQLTRFGFVGSFAAAVHFAIVIFLVEVAHWHPLQANMVAFLFSFQVSYWGHRTVTFRGTAALHRVAFPRLLVVCSSGFVANQSLFYVFLVICKLPYILALFLVSSILPLLSFIINKFWVFRS